MFNIFYYKYTNIIILIINYLLIDFNLNHHGKILSKQKLINFNILNSKKFPLYSRKILIICILQDFVKSYFLLDNNTNCNLISKCFFANI